MIVSTCIKKWFEIVINKQARVILANLLEIVHLAYIQKLKSFKKEIEVFYRITDIPTAQKYYNDC